MYWVLRGRSDFNLPFFQLSGLFSSFPGQSFKEDPKSLSLFPRLFQPIMDRLLGEYKQPNTLSQSMEISSYERT